MKLLLVMLLCAATSYAQAVGGAVASGSDSLGVLANTATTDDIPKFNGSAFINRNLLDAIGEDLATSGCLLHESSSSVGCESNITFVDTAGDILFIIQGGASEADNLFEIKDSGGTVNAAITAAGVLAATSALVGPFGASRITGQAGFYQDMPEITPSGNPAADTLRLYVSAADGNLYYRDSAGTDVEIGAAGSVGADTIGTSELDDASDTPVENYLAAVDSATTGFQYIQVGTGLSVSGSEYARTLAIAATTVDTTSAQTLETKTLTAPSLGDDSALTRRVPNDTGSGTADGDLAEIQDDGANAEEAITAGVGDTNKHVYPVSTGGGTTGNVELAVVGEVQIDMDGACAVGDNVILSTGVAGEGHCTSSPLAQNVHCVGVATQTTGAAGLADVDLSADCSRVAEGVGETETILFPLFNGGSALAASSDDGDRIWVRMPYSCDITSVEVTADASGSVVVDLWKDTYANFPPTDADSITASAPPTLSTAQKAQDTTLTGWTTQVNAGDYITANIDSATTVTNVLVAVQCTRD